MCLSRPSFSQSLAATGLAVTLSCTTLPAFAGNGHDKSQATPPAVAEQARQKAADHTQALMALQKRWARAQGAEKSRALQQMIARAEERRAFLSEQVKTDPAAVLQVEIPEDKQQGMPGEVIAKLEQRLVIPGELDVVYEDYEDGRHKLRHFLKSPFGERFELRFAQKHAELKAGTEVEAEGLLLAGSDTEAEAGEIAGDLLIDNSEADLLQLADGGTGSGTAYDLPNAMGEQKTLVMLVNFQDKPSEKPWTISQANSLIFGTVDAFYRENSSNQSSVAGDVAGWFTLPVSSTSCDGFAIEGSAKQAAQAAGYNLSNYDRFVFAFPKNACGYSGMGQVGVVPSSTWINGSLELRTVAHELGHNLGLHHAHALDCGDTTLSSNCSSQEYGDTLDIMGYSGTVGHFNTFQKERLGWLASNNILELSTGGSYTLVPSAQQSNGIKALKILKGADSTNGGSNYYYVEFRRPLGFDAQLTDRGVIDANNAFNGVAVHQANPAAGNSSYLLDMTPGSSFIDMRDPALTGGQSYSDNSAGVTLTTEWTTSTQALVSVDLGSGSGSGQACSHAKPTVSLSPGQSSWVAAGSQVSYSLTVKNNDNSACSNSSFSLSASKPSGWTTSYNTTSLNLAPGATGSATLYVTSSSSTTDGFYTITGTASANSQSASSSVTYVVDNPITTTNMAPVAVNDSVTLSTKQSVTIAVLSNDWDPDNDSLRIAGASQGSKGSVRINSNGTLTYTPAKSFKSGDSFSYSISDGKATASATVSIQLSGTSDDTINGKGNGKGKSSH